MYSMRLFARGKRFSRIRLAGGLLALACLFSVAPLSAATPVDVQFAASTVYGDRAVILQAQLYKPEGRGPFPAVVLMHGCGGMLPAARSALQTYAEFLVRSGYVALSLDSFGPRGNGDGWVCAAFDRLMHARRYRTADALDALQYLRTLDFVDRGNIFQMGQSNGGSVAILLAQLQQPAFRATVAYYPWCGALNRRGNKIALTSPLLVLGGALDDWTPPGDCQTADSSGAEYRVVVYPAAVHSFDLEIPRQHYQGRQVGYDERAALDSRRQMLAFFDAHLTDERRASMPRRFFGDITSPVFLSAAEIRRLLPVRRLEGVDSLGVPYAVSFRADGGMTGVAGEQTDQGKWWTDGDMFCRQYQTWLQGAAACFRVSLYGDNLGFYDFAGNYVSGGILKR